KRRKLMRVHYLLIFAIVSVLLFTVGCSNTEDKTTKDNTEEADAAAEDENSDDKQENGSENDKNDQDTDDEDYRSDLGNLEIWIGGEVTIEEDKVIVAGESNLLPGARNTSSAVSDGWAVINYQDSTEVEEDGSFHFELPGSKKDTVVTLNISTGNNHVKEHYGENLEKATGNQVYKTDTQGKYEARYTFEIDSRNERPYTIDLETPDWSNI